MKNKEEFPWYNPIEDPPPENTDVLIYTDTDKMKVARYYNNRWDTYLKVIAWGELPKNKPRTKKENQ